MRATFERGCPSLQNTEGVSVDGHDIGEGLMRGVELRGGFLTVFSPCPQQ
jgi:hypothetical protein